MIKRAILLILLVVPIVANAQIRNYSPVNYGPKNYGQNYDAENYAIAQNAQGIMFFGTANAIFKYDGSFWDRISVKPGVWVKSILTNPTCDTIFVGGSNEFGMLLLHENGESFDYYSLSDSIRNYISPFSEIWKIYRIDGRVYFQSYNYIFAYDGEKITIIEPSTTFHNSFCVNNKLYVRQREVGLAVLNADTVSVVPNGDVFANVGIFGMLSIDGDSILIVSYEDGSWILHDNKITPNTSKLDKTIKNEDFKVTSCILINDTTLALGSYDNGVMIVNTDGTIVSHKNINNGLIDNCINNIFCDREQNIWITTNKGITLLPTNDVISVFSSESGINGSVNAVIDYKGQLFVGTSNGLLVQKRNLRNYTEALFEEVGNLKNTVWCLARTSESLFVGTADGLFVMSAYGKFEKLSSADVHCISVSADGMCLFAGGSQGLIICENIDNKWIPIIGEAEGFSVTDIENQVDSIGIYTIWLGSSTQGIAQVNYDGFDASVEYYGETNGLKPGPSKPIKLYGQVMFLNNGIICKTGNERVTTSIDDTLHTYELFYFTPADELNMMGNLFMVKSDDNTAWISQGTNIAYYSKGDSTLNDKKFRGLDVGKINAIYATNNRYIWLGTVGGLVMCDNYSPIDYVSYYVVNREIITDAPNVFIRTPNKKISYKYNSLSFNFSAPWFRCPGALEYSYYLSGLMTNWSNWLGSNSVSFNNLREGKYIFQVRARNVFGIESSIAEYSFTIRPPWYRTIVAYVIYLLLVMLMIYGGVKYYTYQLKARNRLLDMEVKRQTKQISEQLDTIKEQNMELTDSINYAARIQRLSLPNTECMKNYVSDSFILFKPRDIVSGDFYWCAELGKKLIITAADCTGHGVPGAMMSMLGMNSLNSIVKVEHNDEPGIILDELRESIIRSFSDKGDNAAKDGMDLCLLAIDREKMEVQFAGAHNPLFLIRNGELIEYKVDKMPCAFGDIVQNQKHFANNTISVQEGDCLYFFSDGYCDQFGGQNGTEKFKKNRFRQSLLQIWNLPMERQRQILDNIHIEFKADYEQVDDILVIGLRI
ncbi:MAG: SpoIIE family protein phosphatase [Salinivirgaceae bacterium]|nr:SpoIIE family protein phosphatase [Salinivirgaceae bacterium]